MQPVPVRLKATHTYVTATTRIPQVRPTSRAPQKKQGNFRGAANAYSRALQLDPPDPAPLLANRAACRHKLSDAAACRADCSAGIERVRADLERLEAAGGLEGGAGAGAPGAGPEGEAVAQDGRLVAPANAVLVDKVEGSAAGPKDGGGIDVGGQQPAAQLPPGERLRRLLVKLLARRAAAAAELGELAGAESDLVEALRCGGFASAGVSVGRSLGIEWVGLRHSDTLSSNATIIKQVRFRQRATGGRPVRGAGGSCQPAERQLPTSSQPRQQQQCYGCGAGRPGCGG
jgi:hypothetical protein